MPKYFYSQAITPETCFEAVQNLPDEIVEDNVYVRVEPQGVCVVLVDEQTKKKARLKGRALVEKRLSEAKNG
jgi:hypothetical protein